MQKLKRVLYGTSIWSFWNACFLVGDGIWWVIAILNESGSGAFEGEDGKDLYQTLDVVGVIFVWLGCVGLWIMQTLGNVSAEMALAEDVKLWYKDRPLPLRVRRRWWRLLEGLEKTEGNHTGGLAMTTGVEVVVQV